MGTGMVAKMFASQEFMKKYNSSENCVPITGMCLIYGQVPRTLSM
jgi:hypothetical protein